MPDTCKTMSQYIIPEVSPSELQPLVDKWNRILYSTGATDKQKTFDNIARIYELAKLPFPKRVEWVTSPMQASILSKEGTGEVITQRPDGYPNDKEKPVVPKLIAKECKKIYRKAYNIWNQVQSKINATSNVLCINQFQPYRCMIYDSLMTLGISKEYVDWIPAIALTETCGPFYLFQNMVIISDKPTEIHVDEESRLHYVGGKAICWADGFGVAAYHGVETPETWLMTPAAQWDPKWLIGTDNMEYKRILFEVIGYGRIMQSFDHKVIDRDKKQDMELAIVKGIDVEDVHLLKVVCPSTGAFYTLRVPPEIKTCEAARRWTLHDEKNELNFLVET